MKKLTLVFAIALTLGFARQTSAQQMPQFPAGSMMAAIQQRGTLNVGVKPDILGVGYQNPMTGKYEGFTVDLAADLAQRIFGSPGHVTYKSTEASTRIAMLQQGNIDVDIETLFMTKERADQVDFAEPYWGAPTLVFVKKDNAAIKSVKDLGGKRVAATKGSAAERAFENPASGYPKAELVLLDSIAEVVDAVRINRADAAVFDEALGLAAIKATPDFKFVGPPVTYNYYGIAVAKNHPEFLAFINKWLGDVKSNGKWVAMYKKNLPGDPSRPPTAPYDKAFYK
jgi:polar amino acid transport system substrate-binding protein